MRTILWNPFYAQPERRLLVAGILLTAFGLVSSIYTGIVQDGVLDLHYADVALWQHVLALAVNVVVLTGFSFAAGRLINPKCRLVDLIAVTLVSRAPMYISIWVLYFFPLTDVIEKLATSAADGTLLPQLSAMEWMALMLTSIGSLLFLAWYLLLHFQGFRVAVHAKRAKHYVYWLLVILLAEVLSKILVYLFI